MQIAQGLISALEFRQSGKRKTRKIFSLWYLPRFD